jgi:Tfp pilus assembly protein PilF
VKRYAALIVLVLAALLIATGMLVRHRDPATAYTDRPEAWQAYEDGDRLMQAFRHSEADTLLQHAIDLDPNLAPAHAALGELAMRLGQTERMRHHLALADSLTAELASTRARLLVQVRLATLRQSRFHAVRDSLLDLALTVVPREIAVLSSIAMRASQAGDSELAEATWRQILEINPNHAAAYNFLGYLHLEQGRFAEAEQAMRRYAFVAPDLANPHDSLGEVLMTVGRYEEAERELRIAMQKQPDFPYAPVNLALIHLARGEVVKAVSLFEQVLVVLSGTALERGFLSRIIQSLFIHRLTELLDAYSERYLALDMDTGLGALADAQQFFARGEVRVQQLLGRGEALAAVAYLDSLQAYNAAEPWLVDAPHFAQRIGHGLTRWRALAAEQLGLHDAAVDLLQQALGFGESAPPQYRILDRLHLAYNLIPLGRFDEARVEIRQVLAINPRQAEAILIAASIEAAAGNLAEAARLLTFLEQALVRADPDFPALQDARQLRERLPEPDHI